MIKKLHSELSQKNIDRAIASLKDDHNNAISFVYEQAKISTHGPLAGVPITIKDNIATNDAPTQASSNSLKNFMTGYDATVVKLMRNAGATIVGKTNLDELALGGTGLFSCNGIITNPLNSENMIGGSSSGAAASLNKYVGVAFGSDTGDSVRIPASYVGIVGFKPSYGAVSRYGLFPYATSLDHVGWFTHSILDSAIVSSILFQKDLKDSTSKQVEFKLSNIKELKPRKIGYICVEDETAPYVKAEMNKLISSLREQKIEVHQVKIDIRFLKAIKPVYQIISFSEVASIDSNITGLFFGNHIVGSDWEEVMRLSRQNGFGSVAMRRMILGSLFLERDNQEKLLLRAQKIRRLIVEVFNKELDKYDLLILPSAISIAPKIKDGVGGISNITTDGNYADSILAFGNFAGVPSLTIPWGNHEGLPFGLNLNKKLYEDEKLLSYALYIEKLIRGKNE